MTSPSKREFLHLTAQESPHSALLPSPFSRSDENLTQPAEQHVPPDDTPQPEPRLEYVEAEQGSLVAPANFAPYFTMMMDQESGETYHPSTYYVFNDDEPDVLSNAALQALEASTAFGGEEEEVLLQEDERFVLLSMDASGTNIVSARSLAPSWAVTSAQVRPAPTFDGDGQGGHGQMLLVEGIAGERLGSDRPAIGTTRERQQTAKSLFEEARHKTGGGVISAMDELAQNLLGGIAALDKLMGAE